MARDWQKTLFPASYNGVPFFVSDDRAETGRRTHTAMFPGSDEPFHEDLGRAVRPIEISGYCVGDTSDLAMAALEAACEAPGQGFLMLPAQGLVGVQRPKVKRRRERDRAGYFAFDASFERAGMASPFIPGAALAQGTFNASAQLAAAASAFLNSGMQL